MSEKKRHGAQADLYLCALLSLGLWSLSLASYAGALQSDWGRQLESSLLGACLPVLPGYSLARALGLDRFGVAALAGLAFALSIALLALVGAGVWLILGAFSPLAVQSIALGLTLMFCAVGLLRSTPAHDTQSSQGDRPALLSHERWSALGLALAPLVLAVVALSPNLPAAAATRYTEFHTGTRAQGGAVQLEVVNREGVPATYRIEAQVEGGSASTGEFRLDPHGSWLGPAPLSVDGGDLRLYLFKDGDHRPYRTLFLPAAQSGK